ncbi:hypothetical protein [Nocardia sp.]|uniref:hypothetical protein n=1 Tax=Nocardia sp. TaxID=1821 RepID=UPI00262475EB|nr:hypothetical protein [Nocardia sp.]
MSSAGSAPFAAAVAAAAGKAARPVDVVGDDVNGDLMLARTLLGGVLAATESLVGIAWAVCVLRGPAGAGLFMTSNEGRGWLPAGLFLPREMSTPWLWDDLLGVQKTGSPWEGIADPARILSEFGTAWGSKANARITAVVSSGPIDPGMRASLPDVAMEGLVNPSSDLDLRTQIPGTTDRLGLTGSIDALKSLVTVGDSAIRSHCLDLAADAHAQVARSVPVSAAATRGRVLRDRIVATLRAGEPVTDALWRQLRDADDLLAAAMISLRTDVGGVGLGEIHADDAAARLRGVVFDRRCNELVLGLAGESNRQSLRDAVYAHEQVVAHPAFVAAPVSVSAHVPAPVTGDGSVTVSADYARPVERLREKADSPDADTGFESR